MEDEKLQEIVEKLVDSFSDEQKEKAAACETLDDLIKLAGDEGIELPEELLDEVGGGRLTIGGFLRGGFRGIKPLVQVPVKQGVQTIFSVGSNTTATPTVFNAGNKTTADDAVFRTTGSGSTTKTIKPTVIISGDFKKA